MGWSFRRSIKMGPLNLNLSSRGVGASVGVRGVRVSVGPRGTYVTFGHGGFQYRQKLHDAPKPHHLSQKPSTDSNLTAADGHIHTATATDLVESSPEKALQELQARLTRTNWLGWYAAGVLLLALMLPSPLGGLALLLGIASCIPLHLWIENERTARLFYDVDDEELVARLALANLVGHHLATPSRLWHIYYAAATSDWKKNGGAGELIRRTITRAAPGTLPHIDLNVEPFCVPVGPQQLLFLPDRLVVWDGKHLAGLPYETLDVSASSSRFIEQDGKPADARQVDTTWRFVNRDGGPDRRFKDNHQIPVMEYGRLEIRSPEGLRVVLDTSTPEAAERAAAGLNELRARASRSPKMRAIPTVRNAAAGPPLLPTPSNHNKPADLAPSVAILFRYIAAADRRISDDEIDFANQHAGRVLPTREAGDIEQMIRTAPGDDGSVNEAIRNLLTADDDYRRTLIDLLTQLSLADGKATPKEVERLGVLRSSLRVA